MHNWQIDYISVVLSIKLVWIDNTTVSDGSDESHYNYHVSTHLHPTILHFDWTTVHRLAEFGAVVRGTHKEWVLATNTQHTL